MKRTLDQLTGVFKCGCGTLFTDAENAREHIRECDEMPHIDP